MEVPRSCKLGALTPGVDDVAISLPTYGISDEVVQERASLTIQFVQRGSCFSFHRRCRVGTITLPITSRRHDGQNASQVDGPNFGRDRVTDGEEGGMPAIVFFREILCKGGFHVGQRCCRWHRHRLGTSRGARRQGSRRRCPPHKLSCHGFALQVLWWFDAH